VPEERRKHNVDDEHETGTGKRVVDGIDSMHVPTQQVLVGKHYYVTESSTEFTEDLSNYLWKIDKKTGKPLNVPEHAFSHTPDALRYGTVDVINPSKQLFRVRSA
jgi:hypothetical protein